MSLEDWRRVFVILGISLVLSSSSPLISKLLSPVVEPFTAMAILGENGMAEGYYPNGDMNIRLGESVKWYVYLYNHEGETTYLLVKVKMLDLNSTPPNSTSCLPSPASSVYEFHRVLHHNETVILPFEWSIVDAENVSDSLTIKGLFVNGHYIHPSLSLSRNGMFRFVFELWVYDENSNRFRFDLGDGSRCVWNQIWFNLTLSM